MQELKYYIPISSTSLSHIYAYGCILPAQLYRNRPDDIQSKWPDVLLLTLNHGVASCDCCLQVLLTTEEEKEYLYELGNDYFIFERAIPVSRILSIEFTSESQRNTTVSAIQQSTAYIPQDRIKIVTKFENREIPWKKRPADFKGSSEFIATHWKKFDQYLGALALMRVAKEDGLNCSKRYIDTLSYFNTKIREEKQRISPIENTFYSILEKGSPEFDNEITPEMIERSARQKNITLKKNPITRVLDFESLSWPLYCYAILQSYGCGEEARRKRIDDLILNNFQIGLKDGMGEGIAFYYGYNRGYNVFNNAYHKDKKSVVIKYKLESLLDYYTIESVFNTAFYNSPMGTIPYLDHYCTKKKYRKPAKGGYMILDTVIYDKKKEKVLSDGWWKQFLDKINLKCNFLGTEQNFNIAFIQTFLRPFAEYLHNDLKEEMAESFDDEREELMVKIKTLEDELARLNTEGHKPCTDMIVTNENVEDKINQSYSTRQNLNDKERLELVVKATNLMDKRRHDLENMMYGQGLSIKRGMSKEQMVIELLTAPENNLLFK